jgi:DNA-binding MarR family transcriptional regulator
MGSRNKKTDVDKVRGRALAIVETALPYALHRFTIALARAKDQAFERDLGLSSADWRILITIGAFAPLSTKQLSGLSQIDKSTVSRTTASLAQRNLVARKVDNGDQRLVVLKLSPRGHTLCDIVARSIARWDDLLLQALSKQQLATLHNILKVLPDQLCDLVARDALRPISES